MPSGVNTYFNPVERYSVLSLLRVYLAIAIVPRAARATLIKIDFSGEV